MKVMGVIRLLAVFLLCFLWDNVKAQLVCQQHVMTSATATENTQFSYTMCDGTPNTLNFIPGFTTIQCAVVGSVSVVSGDGWWGVMAIPHPDWEDCSIYNCPPPSPCPADLNGDGIVQTADLLILLQYYGQPCE
tara:strand:- start:391 stop:792 length:402 start_codon:yes stop_codon:yes gene_type:complete